jgi:hypothetical protein
MLTPQESNTRAYGELELVSSVYETNDQAPVEPVGRACTPVKEKTWHRLGCIVANGYAPNREAWSAPGIFQ